MGNIIFMVKGSLMATVGFLLIIFFFVFFIFLMSCLSPNSSIEGICAPFDPIIQFVKVLAGG